MKAPICNVCLSSDILCKVDKEKLETGIISESDVEISRKIYRLSKTLRPLRNITIKKIVETENFIIIICKIGDVAKIVGRSGVIVKKLSRVLKKNVKVVEEAKNMKDFIQKLLFPIPIIGTSILYTPEKELYRVRIPSSRIPLMPLNEIITAVKVVYGNEIEIII